jgi:hypothetical protein
MKHIRTIMLNGEKITVYLDTSEYPRITVEGADNEAGEELALTENLIMSILDVVTPEIESDKIDATDYLHFQPDE